MKAAIYEANGLPGEVLRVVELPDPVAGPGEVLVRVHASGVNPSAIARLAGTLQIDLAEVMPLSQIARAHEAQESGRTVGNLVLTA